ncbi:vasoactive intestinal polypeptide receptor 1-like isoform X1 [Serinus canaria]|uniref:vasoactive intestinal polypeptide receptor 1-like isoform X1 n=1 Tax=Serinus canaria TaxID=9135 RepID=UPI0021CD0FA5|nr:vasoactive intestinal polypeptide receptor 1-like isoform X1 [Serinus canaria]
MGGPWQPPRRRSLLLLLLLLPTLQVQGTHPDCSIVLHFQELEEECLQRIRSESHGLGQAGQGCPTEWDGVSCWPALPLGQSRGVACPEILSVFKSKGLIQRNCTEWGWSPPSPPYHSACHLETLGSNNDTEAKRGHFVTMKVLYTCGYSTSLAALLLAISIFCCFRKLHCTRNSIHIHFFTSFILRGTAVFIKDHVLFSDESLDHCTMSTVTCKAAITFFQYSVLANFYWLLVEGLYLQTLLLLTFTCDRSYTWGYVLMGWGVPMVTVGVWVLTRLQYDNHGCWDDYSSVYWWVIKAPILLAIFVNFLIFLNVTRMLAQKIRCPDLSRTHKQQYMRLTKSTLLLIPLFGVHYVVFALFPEHVGVDARLYFELVLGSYQGFLVALLYCFLNGEVSVCPHPKPQAPQWAWGHPEGAPKPGVGRDSSSSPCPQSPPLGARCPWVPAPPVLLGQVQAEIRRNWGTWQRSMESNVFNLATQDFTA